MQIVLTNAKFDFRRLVIMNLVSISNGKSLHVPYRDSKLTFLLQVKKIQELLHFTERVYGVLCHMVLKF